MGRPLFISMLVAFVLGTCGDDGTNTPGGDAGRDAGSGPMTCECICACAVGNGTAIVGQVKMPAASCSLVGCNQRLCELNGGVAVMSPNGKIPCCQGAPGCQ